MAFKTSNNGINLIKKFEGCPTKNGMAIGYLDTVNVPTIGWGHTGKVDGISVYKGMMITLDKATKLLQEDLLKFENKVNKYYSKYNWTQNETDALVSFCYNIGNIDQLTANGTRSKSVIADKILEYNTAGKKTLVGLTTRRKAERELFLSGSKNASSVSNNSSKSTTNSQSPQRKENTKIVQKWINEYIKSNLSSIQKYQPTFKYIELKIDGEWGSKSKTAFNMAIQIAINNTLPSGNTKLIIDGKIGSKTKSLLPVIKLNSSGDIVKLYQGLLFVKGYNPQAFNGKFDSNTATVTAEFQKENKLKDDKIVGINTWNLVLT